MPESGYGSEIYSEIVTEYCSHALDSAQVPAMSRPTRKYAVRYTRLEGIGHNSYNFLIEWINLPGINPQLITAIVCLHQQTVPLTLC